MTIFNKIIKGQDLSTGPQKYGMTQNILFGESLRVFDHKTWYRGTETNYNYNLAMKELMNHLLPPKAINIHKRYLQRGIYKPCDTKIREVIFRIDEIVEYLNNLPLFWANQVLLEDDILKLMEFFLPI